MTHKLLAQLTEGEVEELGVLGLTVQEFAHFTDTFVHQLFGHIYRTGDTWKSPPSTVPLKNIDLIRHLAGNRVIGTRCGEHDRRLVTTSTSGLTTLTGTASERCRTYSALPCSFRAASAAAVTRTTSSTSRLTCWSLRTGAIPGRIRCSGTSSARSVCR